MRHRAYCLTRVTSVVIMLFSLNAHQTRSELVTKPENFLNYMFCDLYNVWQFCFVSDTVALVQWRYVTINACRATNVKVFEGAMTTAHARLMLYDLLAKLQQRVLYSDN